MSQRSHAVQGFVSVYPAFALVLLLGCGNSAAPGGEGTTATGVGTAGGGSHRGGTTGAGSASGAGGAIWISMATNPRRLDRSAVPREGPTVRWRRRRIR